MCIASLATPLTLICSVRDCHLWQQKGNKEPSSRTISRLARLGCGKVTVFFAATLKGWSVDEMSKRRMLFVLQVEQPVTTWLLMNLFQVCLLGMCPRCLLWLAARSLMLLPYPPSPVWKWWLAASMEQKWSVNYSLNRIELKEVPLQSWDQEFPRSWEIKLMEYHISLWGMRDWEDLGSQSAQRYFRLKRWQS